MTAQRQNQSPPVSIGLLLNFYSLVIAVLPVTIIVIIALNLFSDQAADQAENQLTSLAQVKTRDIDRWLDTSQTTLRLVLANPGEVRRMVNILGTPGRTGPTGQRVTEFLEAQLNLQSAYEEFFLYNTDGIIRISTDEDRVGVNLNMPEQPYVELGFEIYPGLLAAGRQTIQPRIQPAYFDPVTDEIKIIVVHPIINETNNVVGAIAGRLSVEDLNIIMETRVGLGETGETYLVSAESSRFITPGRFGDFDPAVTYTSTGIERGIEATEGSGFYTNYRGEEVAGVYRWIEPLDAVLLAEIEESEALAAVDDVREVSVIAALVTGVIVLIIGRGITLWITRPIDRLREVAEAVLSGDYSKRANLRRLSEIGELGAAFDTMTANLVEAIGERDTRIKQIEELSTTLEQRVEARTRDLRVAADVSRQLTRVLDTDELLQKVVTLTLVNFELYVCMVYRYDEKTEQLHLAAAIDHNGDPLRLSGMNIITPAQDDGIMAQAVRSREAVVVNDTRKSLIYKQHQDLPRTRSEVAIPLLLGDRLLGVFDLQHDLPDHFDQEEISVLTTLAEQISVGLRNAQLYTEAQAARAEAERANQVKSQFLASMSHELRTPLNAILNFTEFVADGVMGEVNEQQVDALNKAIESGDHLLSLINDILDLTKIEVGMMELFWEAVDLNWLLESVLSTARSLVKNKPSVEIITHIEDDLPTIAGDKRRLRQVLLNLISNAVKFTPQGTVTITAERINSDVVITIADTGVGIAPEEKPYVFENFRQTESGLSTGSGTGLGLPISQHFVEAHNGTIQMQSTVNVGTTFTVRLPVTETEAPQT
jgi:signal transduction histidine kinase/HAMP domain-containing protein